MKQILSTAMALTLGACGAETETRRSDAPPTPAPPFAALPAAADAPSGAVPRSAPAPEPVLVPGDLLAISVFRQPDLQLEVRIPQEGKITYPLIGSVQAAGKTTAQLELTLKQRLEKDFLQDPSVTVTVKDYAPRKVYVVGGVAKPGGYEVFPTSRLTLLQAIAAAEGLTDRAYKEYVQVVRRRGPSEREVLHVNLVQVERLIAQGHPEADLELWPDDLVVIPSAVRVAYVLGQVNKPGQVEVPNGARMTVSMAVSHAGSYTKFAATSRVMLLRTTPTGETRKYAVDLDAILNGRLELDLDLQPGDVVWVPERGIF